MLSGEKIGLRARLESDVPILHAELYDDVETQSRAGSRAWRPISLDSSDSPFAVRGPADDSARFSVVRLTDGELVGSALLWGIDLHNRTAHLGLSLRPSFRRQGLGTDIVRVLCQYGFTVRGLHRLQLETLADNTAMIKAATRAGFVLEGTLRSAGWVNGTFLDEVVFGLLGTEWSQK